MSANEETNPVIEGHTKYDAGDHRGAIAAFARALALPGLSKKTIAGIYMNRGNAYSNLGEYQTAHEDWQRIAGLSDGIPEGLRDAAQFNAEKCRREHPDLFPSSQAPSLDPLTKVALIASAALESPQQARSALQEIARAFAALPTMAARAPQLQAIAQEASQEEIMEFLRKLAESGSR